MTIAIEMKGDVAVFRYPPGYAGVVDEFEDLLDRREAGGLDEDKYLRALEELVARHPWFIDGHAHTGTALYDRGDFERALNACERGFSLGAAALPGGFEEFIEWRYDENRPFLRAAHGLALCQLRLDRFGDAVSTLEKMLAWNEGELAPDPVIRRQRVLIKSDHSPNSKLALSYMIPISSAPRLPMHVSQGEVLA